MTSTGIAFAVPNQVCTVFGGPITSFLVVYSAVVSDGVSQSIETPGSFIYDTTQPVATNVCVFKASVAAVAAEFGLTIPVSNIIVFMGVN